MVDLDAADFAVVAGGHIPPRGFEGAPLYDERLIPVCSPAFARSARIETPAMLARTQLLISRRDLWSLWFSRAGLVSEPNISGPLFADPALAMEAALQGQGVALCCTVAAAGSVAGETWSRPYKSRPARTAGCGQAGGARTASRRCGS